MTQTIYRGRWPIVALLLAILGTGILVAVLGRAAYWRESMVGLVLTQAILISLAQLQTSLAALWLAWGMRRLPIRFVMLCLTIYLCAYEYYAMIPPDEPPTFRTQLTVFWGIYSLVLVFCATTIRIGGFRLQRFTPSELNSVVPPVRSLVAADFTFSLRAVFAWIAGIAILSALVRFALVFEPWREFTSDISDMLRNLRSDPWRMLAFGINHVIPLTLGWAVLTIFRLAIAFVACVCTTLTQYLGGKAPDVISLGMDAEFVGLTALALLVFRRAGYRLLWRKMRVVEPAQA